MNTENELFGELHEQEENGLFGNEHRRQYEAQQEALRLSTVINAVYPSCGRNITTCVFYKDGGKCSNLEYCRDQTT